MTPHTLSSDDPRLTAYALGEMAEPERTEFEKLLQADPAARAIADEIRATGAALTAALEGEAVPAAEPLRKAAIVHGGGLGKLDGGGTIQEQLKQLNRPIRFPQLYFMISGLAAACFALFFVYWQRNQPVVQPKSYVEYDLGRETQAVEKRAPVEQAAVSRESGMPDHQAVADASIPVGPPAVTFELPTAPVPPSTDPFVAGERPDQRAGKSARSSAATGMGANHGHSDVPTPAASGMTLAAPSEQLHKREEKIVLSPFEVSATANEGYENTSLASGMAFGSKLKDGAAPARQIGHDAVAGRPTSFAPPPGFDTEAYGYRKDSDYLRVADHPLSTFAVDVDTASYANVRRFLTQGKRPPADAVRIEELVNYFPYRYAEPTGKVPFAASLEVAAAPWKPEHRLVRIGLKGREVSAASRPAANLVFLIDVSGSMRPSHKLPLVKQALRLLVDKLRGDDRVAIAVYAGSSGLALPSTPAARKVDILDAIDRLEAGGSTNGAMGIHLAYDIARANFVAGGVNRVVLATDGDFNVGTTSEGELVRLVEEKAKAGVFLSVLGFGMGNLKDGMLEQIADKGNGNYAYIDSLAEARKALVEQAGGTLVTIAKDVKIQVEFNPARVAAYRLIGYENRLLAKEDFNNDKIDAGEIGAGHTVTALYEIVPAGAELPGETPAVDGLKYQPVNNPASGIQQNLAHELLTVKVRYKEPAGEASNRLEFPLRDTGTRFEDASQDFKFAAAVAAFGMVLRDSPHRGSLTLADVSAWARAGLGSDTGGYRSEFLGLVEKTQPLLQ